MAAEPIIVMVDPDLADLIPVFLKERYTDQAAIAAALPQHDYDAIRKAGHAMAGAGTSYGFDLISHLGERLEHAARAGDAGIIAGIKVEFDDYLARVVVKYL